MGRRAMRSLPPKRNWFNKKNMTLPSLSQCLSWKNTCLQLSHTSFTTLVMTIRKHFLKCDRAEGGSFARLMLGNLTPHKLYSSKHGAYMNIPCLSKLCVLHLSMVSLVYSKTQELKKELKANTPSKTNIFPATQWLEDEMSLWNPLFGGHLFMFRGVHWVHHCFSQRNIKLQPRCESPRTFPVILGGETYSRWVASWRSEQWTAF